MAANKQTSARRRSGRSKESPRKDRGKDILDFLNSFTVAAREAFVLTDCDYGILYMNEEARALFSLGTSEPSGVLFFDLIPGDYRATVKKGLAAAVNHTGAPTVSFQISSPGKTSRSIEVVLTSLEDERGYPQALILILRDVTRDLWEREKREQNDKTIRALLDASHDGAFLINADSTIMALNEEALKRLRGRRKNLKDKPMEFFLGTKLSDYYPEEAEKETIRQAGMIRKTGKPRHFRITVGNRILDLSVYPVFDRKHRISHYAVYSRDKTDERFFEEKTRESERKYWNLIDQMYEGYVILDRKGIIVYANQRVADASGYTKKEITGKEFIDFFTGPNRSKLEALYLRAGNFERIRFEADATTGNGETISIMISVSPIRDKKGDYDGLQAVITDITAIKEARENLNYRIEFEKQLIEISKNFINLDAHEVDTGIARGLDIVGQFNNEDIIFFYTVNPGGNSARKYHVWRKDPDLQNIEFPEELDFADYPVFTPLLKKRKVIHVPDVNVLQDEAQKETEFGRILGIQSFLIVPVIFRRSSIGWLGIASMKRKRWTEDQINLIKTAAGIFATALERKSIKSELIDVILNRLSERERELVLHLAEGLKWPRDKRLIGKRMDVLPGTLDKFMLRIKEKIRSNELELIIQILHHDHKS